MFSKKFFFYNGSGLFFRLTTLHAIPYSDFLYFFFRISINFFSLMVFQILFGHGERLSVGFFVFEGI